MQSSGNNVYQSNGNQTGNGNIFKSREPAIAQGAAKQLY